MFTNAAHKSAFSALSSMMGSRSRDYRPVLHALAWLDAKGKAVRPALQGGSINFALLLAESGFWDASDVAFLQATATVYVMLTVGVPAMVPDEVLHRLEGEGADVLRAAVKMMKGDG